MMEFNEFINNTRLIEIPMGGRKFTRVSDDEMKFSKLDCFLLNEKFNEMWGNLSVVALDRKLPDHCPIVIKDVELDFGPKPFRVFNIWLEESDFSKVVEVACCIFRDRLKNVKASLRIWSKGKFGGHKKKMEKLRNDAIEWELETKKRVFTDRERESWLEARKQCTPLLPFRCDLILGVLQWDIEGDENSKFFHAHVRRRNNKCNIRGLMVNGLWCEDPTTIKEEMARYYKKLFSKGGVIRPIFYSNKIVKILEEEAHMLELGFNEKVIQWFWDKMEISRGCNASFITIIPKVADPLALGDFCPISLIGCYYKIIAKILAERVKRVVGNVVGEVQNAFIKGRFILDGVLVANKTMEYLKKKKERERLNAIVTEAVEKGIFRGVIVGENKVTFSHLQYVDDTIFFGEWNKENSKSLLCILKCFEEVSGLKVNYNKSKIYGVGVNDGDMAEMARWMGCGIGEFPFTYLGLPIGENMRRVNAWGPMVEKFKNRLADWKAKTMSFEGRLTLVKSFLGSLP
ncbi:hypothetical protein Tco_1089304 [Tanacetum coccineum]